MGKAKKVDNSTVWAQATARGQLPNRTWVDETTPPFQIEKSSFSKKWMRELTEKEVAQLDSPEDSDEDNDAELNDLRQENDDLKEKLDKALGENDDLKEKLSDFESSAKTGSGDADQKTQLPPRVGGGASPPAPSGNQNK